MQQHKIFVLCPLKGRV